MSVKRARPNPLAVPEPWMKDAALAWYTPVLNKPEVRHEVVLRGSPKCQIDGVWVIEIAGPAIVVKGAHVYVGALTPREPGKEGG